MDGGNEERPKDPELCNQCLLRFPLLWKLLWENRDLIFHEGFGGSEKGNTDIFAVVTYLLQCHFVMSRHSQ